MWQLSHDGSHGSGPSRNVLIGVWNLFHWIEADSVDLLDIATDLREKTGGAAQNPDHFQEHRSRLEARRKNAEANRPRSKP